MSEKRELNWFVGTRRHATSAEYSFINLHFVLRRCNSDPSTCELFPRSSLIHLFLRTTSFADVQQTEFILIETGWIRTPTTHTSALFTFDANLISRSDTRESIKRGRVREILLKRPRKSLPYQIRCDVYGFNFHRNITLELEIELHAIISSLCGTRDTVSRCATLLAQQQRQQMSSKHCGKFI